MTPGMCPCGGQGTIAALSRELVDQELKIARQELKIARQQVVIDVLAGKVAAACDHIDQLEHELAAIGIKQAETWLADQEGGS